MSPKEGGGGGEGRGRRGQGEEGEKQQLSCGNEEGLPTQTTAQPSWPCLLPGHMHVQVHDLGHWEPPKRFE